MITVGSSFPYLTQSTGNPKGSLPMQSFMNYLIRETDLTKAETPKEIKSEELNEIEAADINLYIDYCRKYMVDNGDTVTVYENNNKSLARKKSSVSVLFKQLYRDGTIDRNITDGYCGNPSNKTVNGVSVKNMNRLHKVPLLYP